MEQRWKTVSTMVAGATVAAGIAAAGWLTSNGMHRFRADVRTVSVKGLVEREVPSDLATWTLVFHRASETLAGAHTSLTADRKAIIGFLHERGFTDVEIETRPTRTFDKLAQDSGDGKKVQLRYVVTSSVVVRTTDVKRVVEATGATEKLLESGVILDFNAAGMANPRYSVSAFNELRPTLLAEATRNARAIAQQFAADSGAVVGKIHSANQGNIQIFGSDGNDESGYYSPTSTPLKKIRVVSTFEFELE